MVNKYLKGYRGERNLVHLLSQKGYMVVRTPHSGSISLASPDIIAAKDGKLIVIECKAREGAFTMTPEQLEELKQWETRGGAIPYVGWKLARKKWAFLKVDDVLRNNGHIGKKFALEKGIDIDQI